ncbi:MAG: flagellar export chaperone FlgN [Phycisphaerae bacterium]
MTPSLDPLTLLELLRRQRGLYERLLELSRAQRGLVAEDRPDGLLTLLRERQELVGELVRLNVELTPYRQAWGDLAESVPLAQRQEVQQLLDAIQDALRRILQSDQEDSAILSARKQFVAQELTEISGASSAHAAYAAGGEIRAPGTADLTG